MSRSRDSLAASQFSLDSAGRPRRRSRRPSLRDTVDRMLSQSSLNREPWDEERGPGRYISPRRMSGR